jgi:hypothetical protein
MVRVIVFSLSKNRVSALQGFNFLSPLLPLLCENSAVLRVSAVNSTSSIGLWLRLGRAARTAIAYTRVLQTMPQRIRPYALRLE